MHTLSIPAIKYNAEFASNIEELTTKQFIYFIHLALKWEADLINGIDFKTMLVVKLLQLRFNPYQVRKKPIDIHITSNIYRIGETLDSFFTEEIRDGKTVKLLNLSFTRNMIPKLKISLFRRLYGPADALTNATFLEYMHAQTHFCEYSKTKNEEHLNKMIATLYRPSRSFLCKWLPNYNGEKRVKYNEYQVEKRAAKIARLPIEVRYGIYLFFKGVEEFLQSGEFEVNGNKIKLSVLYKKTEDSDEPGLGWTGILFTMAETNVFGSVEETAQQNLYDVMLRIYQVVTDQNKILEKYGANKTV